MNDERKQTELELAEMELELCQNECTDLAKQLEIAQSELIRYIGYKSAAQIEAARAERAEAALAAVPWQALANIYECLTLPAVALDGDVDALAAFLNQYAPWVPNESEE